MSTMFEEEWVFEDLRVEYESAAMENANRSRTILPVFINTLEPYGVKINRVSDTEITGLTADNEIFQLKRNKKAPLDTGELSYVLKVNGYMVFSSGTFDHGFRYITMNKQGQ